MSIKWKILIPMLFLAVLGIMCSAVIGFRSLAANDRSTAAFTEAMQIIDAAASIERQAKIANEELDALLEMSRMIDFDASWETFLAASDQISAEIEQVSRLSQNIELVAAVTELETHHAAWRQKAEAFYGKSTGSTSPVLEAVRRDQAGMSAAIVQLSDISSVSAQNRSTALATEVQNETIVVLAVSSLLIGSAILLAYRGAVHVASDVCHIRAELNAISGAESNDAIRKLSEIGQMAEATKLLKSSLAEKERLEAQQKAEEQARLQMEREAEERVAEQQRKEAEAEERDRAAEEERKRELAEIQARIAAEREEAAKQQSHVVAVLAAGLKRLAAGDLGSVIETEFDGPYEALREDFNQAVTDLSKLISKIRERGTSIEGSTAEVVHAARDLAQRAEQSAARVTDIACNLDDVSNVLAGTVSTLGGARESATCLNERAKGSGEIVTKTIEAVLQIEKSSNDIERIISVIDDIAFQTNLLALNAGVEAARAGEAGRGFAVVATEVRTLSQRSAEAAKEIGELIARARTHVQEGAERTSETGKLFEVLVSEFTNVHTVISQIDQGAKQQRDSLNAVLQQTHEINTDIQKNAAMFEETTAAATTMQGELSDLIRSVEIFQVPQKHSLQSSETRAA